MDRIKKCLNYNGIFHFGLIRPEIIEYGKKLLTPYIESDKYSEFAEKNINRRCDHEEILAGTKSILLVLFPYKFKADSKDDGSYGVASFAEGLDYHIENRKILEKVAKELELQSSVNEEYKIHIDNGPMIDRYMAYSAGLGWYGKNSLLINRELGSAFTIGALFMKKSFRSVAYSNSTLMDACGDCRLCIEACPNSAIIDGYGIDCNLCLSERMQSKKEINYKLRESIIEGAYGCDLCQKVCPYNRFGIDAIPSKKNIFDDLRLSKKGFIEKYGDSAFAWRGHNVYKRNLLIVLGNRFEASKDEKAFEAALEHAESKSYMVAIHAWWAMLRIDKNRAASWIREKAKYEKDELKLNEINKLLINYCDEK